MFFVMSSDDTPVCPVCGGTLKYRDTRLRIRKKEGGVKEYLMIRRLRCTECHRHHNELPDWIYQCAESACPVFWKSPVRKEEIMVSDR